MSQFPQVPPPGAYEPPNPSQGSGGGFNPQTQGQPYQQNPSPYQSQTPSPYVPPQQPQKSSSGGFGGMLNQAVTTGKPFLNKLGKTISSKVGGKHSVPSTPQHLESYQQYQQQQQQQQQWQQGAYPSSQQSPHPGSNYASPASGQSGQSNYFAPHQQQSQPQQSQPPNAPQSPQPQQGITPNYNNQYGGQAQNIGQQPGQFPQGQQTQPQLQGQPQAQQPQFQDQGQQQSQFQPQGQLPQGQFQGQTDNQAQNSPFQGTGQPQQGQYQGQAEGQAQNALVQGAGQPQQGQFQPQAQSPTGQYQGQVESQSQNGPFTGTGQPHPGQFQPQSGGVMPSATPQPAPTPPNMVSPVTQQPQQQWLPPTPSPANVAMTNQAPSPAPMQQAQHFAPTPPPQPYVAAPPAPQHPTQPNQQHQWGLTSPIVPTGHPVPSVSPALQHATLNQSQTPSNVPGPAQPQSQKQAPTTSSPPPPKSQPSSAPTEFIAELPADLGNLNLGDITQTQSPPPSSPQPTPQQQYQAYQPGQPGQSQTPPSQGQAFKVARRAVSTSSAPLADPWRIADPATEQPTREFFIVADLLFDGLDRKCEPQNTGILEASKILQNWNMQGLDAQAASLFTYESFCAFALLWTLEGVPHFMVPSQPSLTPSWAVEPNHQALKVAAELPAADSSFPSYIPALNRAGWYKFFFLELVGEPELLEKMMPLFCSDTYKPNSPHHPDLARLEKTPDSELSVRAKQIQNGAAARVCEKVATAMQQSQAGGAQAPQNEQLLQEQALAQARQEAALKMQALQAQQQISNMANQSMVQGGQSFSMAAGNTYVPRY